MGAHIDKQMVDRKAFGMALTTALLRMQLMSEGIIFDHVYGQIMDTRATAVTISISTQPYAIRYVLFSATHDTMLKLYLW